MQHACLTNDMMLADHDIEGVERIKSERDNFTDRCVNIQQIDAAEY